MADYSGPERRAAERDADSRMAAVVEAACDRTAERVVRDVVPVAIVEAFQKFGINTSDPVAVQAQMIYLTEAASRARDPAVLADRAFIRETRLRCEKFWDRFYSGIIQTGVKLFLFLIVSGLATAIGLNLDSIIALVK